MDTISLLAWVAGAVIGLLAGFIRIWLPFLFLVAGTGVAGAMAIVIAPGLSGFIDRESAQTAAAFLAVFAAIELVGVVIAHSFRHAMAMASVWVSLFPMGSLLNRSTGMVAGALFGCILMSVIVVSVQQWPVESVGKGISESSFAGGPIGWVDRYVASIEISQ